MNESIVITGADGFLGSHLVRYFSEHGFQVYALIVPQSPSRERISALKHTTIIEMSLWQWQDRLAELPRKPVALLHLAWDGVSPEARDHVDLQLSNIELCLSVARLAKQIEAQRLIMPGSTAEYAYYGKEINEGACPSPSSAYGAVKVAARYICASYCESENVPFIYAIITGIYAADRDDNNVISYTIRSLLAGQKPSLTRLTQRWDYIYITDVVHALYLIAIKGKQGAVYTIGHGDNCPLYQYVYKIRDIIDPCLPLGIGEIPYRNDRMASSCVDLRAIVKDTGFAPRVSFEEGIKKVIAAMRSRSAAKDIRC